MKNLAPLLLAAGLLAATLPAATRADIVIVAPTATTPGSFNITAPITFTGTTGGNAQLFVLDDYVTSDGGRNLSNLAPALVMAYGGGAPDARRSVTFADNRASSFGQINSGDGYFSTPTPFVFSANTTLTLARGAYAMSPVAGFNPLATQTFRGNMFITDDFGTRISDVVSVSGVVPEPSAYALALVGGLGLLGVVRRRRGAARPRV